MSHGDMLYTVTAGVEGATSRSRRGRRLGFGLLVVVAALAMIAFVTRCSAERAKDAASISNLGAQLPGATDR